MRKADLAKRMKAVSRLCVCKPYAAGPEFTLADLYVFYAYGLAGMLSQKVVQVDLLEGQPQIGDLIAQLAKRPSIARVSAEAGS